VMTTVCVVSLIIAGAASLVSLADRIHPIAGTIVFWTVCLAAGFFVLYYAIAYAGLPAALGPPEEDSGPKHDAYLLALRARLAANPRTRDLPLVTKEEMEKAIGHLSIQADLVVRRTASTVFLSTALMHNGRLDGLMVLFTQIQLVGRIARIYVQRPSPRELMRLYANVAGTAFVASGLDSLELGEMVAPLLAINFADHLINPPELGILERKIKRVPHRRAIVIPSSDKTGGHGSHTIAALWKDQLLNLLKETEK
jgi:hypothetical protein